MKLTPEMEKWTPEQWAKNVWTGMCGHSGNESDYIKLLAEAYNAVQSASRIAALNEAAEIAHKFGTHDEMAGRDIYQRIRALIEKEKT